MSTTAAHSGRDRLHAQTAADDGGLRPGEWLVVHVGSVLFVGLTGTALYLLVRDLPAGAARISSLAIGLFVLFYGRGLLAHRWLSADGRRQAPRAW
jgi:hypothetical protein